MTCFQCFQKLRKKRVIGGLLCVLGFFILIGAAGGLECDLITLKQAIVRSIIGIGIMVFAIDFFNLDTYE